MFSTAVITAGGSGQRFGELKQFKKLNGQPLYEHSLKTFIDVSLFGEIILVVPVENQKTIEQQVKKKYRSLVKVIVGGMNRQDSVKNGVMNSSSKTDLVVIHDASRPFITKKLIKDCILACSNSDGAIIALQPFDTIKYSKSNVVEKTIDREKVWMAQTPQAFIKEKILEAYNNKLDELIMTDESSMMEGMGYKIKIVRGSENNFKITTDNDWKRAEMVLG
ncbi:MAG: 2-C-methyl-D-erythritol 4-phosphate cytidylyltransferase [Candidatus Marinimicrobia bacterium]|nr:2-C-methyl-D-erythritol 4-phosphate cytidylyltransferase [Candidatus Neomarinimicrobiota bacterium]